MTKLFNFKAPRSAMVSSIFVGHRSPDHFYPSGKFICNGHYALAQDWISKCGSKALVKLRDKLNASACVLRLTGENLEDRTARIEQLIPGHESIELNYARVDRYMLSFELTEHKHAVEVVWKLDGTDHVQRFDINYLGLAFIDQSTEVYLHKTEEIAPMLLMRDGQVVAMIMPMRR